MRYQGGISKSIKSSCSLDRGCFLSRAREPCYFVYVYMHGRAPSAEKGGAAALGEQVAACDSSEEEGKKVSRSLSWPQEGQEG